MSQQGPPGLILSDDMVRVEKDWGYEIWITNGDLYCGKILFMRKGEWCSYHRHKIKDEVLYVQCGKIQMNHEGNDGFPVDLVMEQGSAFHVVPEMRHQMYALENTFIIEFSTQHFDEDSYRETRDLVVEVIKDKWENK